MLLRYSQLTHNIQNNKCYKIKLYLHQKIYVFIQKLVEFSLIVFMSGKHNLQFEIIYNHQYRFYLRVDQNWTQQDSNPPPLDREANTLPTLTSWLGLSISLLHTKAVMYGLC